MAEYIGSLKSFKKFIGGYCRNKVRTITSPFNKKQGGICQHCKEKHELQAAHLRSEDRVIIIERILNEHFHTNINGHEKYLVDLNKFEELFIEAHLPIPKHFRFLCQNCHRKYDKGEIEIEEPKLTEFINTLKTGSVKLKTSSSSEGLSDKVINYCKLENETIQNYVKRMLSMLYKNGLLTENLIKQMQKLEYSKSVFGINYPLLETNSKKIKDSSGHNRYWINFKLADKYYVCSQWWKDSFDEYEDNLQNWLVSILN